MVVLVNFDPEIDTDGLDKWLTKGVINKENSLGFFYQGREYNGEIYNGIPNGYGELTTERGIISGNFVSGINSRPDVATPVATTTAAPDPAISGDGTYAENLSVNVPGIGNGTYTGDVLNGKPNGKGVFTIDNGGTYDGEWKNGLPEGQGKMISGDILTYTGEWKNGKYDGQGTLELKNGQKYVGEWRDGQKNGKGIQYYPANINSDPRTEEGTFVDGNLKGDYIRTNYGDWGTRTEYNNTDDEATGTFTRHVIEKSNDGTIDEFDDVTVNFVGQGRINEKHVGVEKDVKDFAWGNGKYTGKILDNQPNGQGTLIEKDYKYVGEWKNGQRYGKGIEYHLNDPNNTELKKGAYHERAGNFVNNQLFGKFTEKHYFANGDYDIRYREAAEDGHWLGDRSGDGEVIIHYERYDKSGKLIWECDEVKKDGINLENRNEKHYD